MICPAENLAGLQSQRCATPIPLPSATRPLPLAFILQSPPVRSRNESVQDDAWRCGVTSGARDHVEFVENNSMVGGIVALGVVLCFGLREEGADVDL